MKKGLIFDMDGTLWDSSDNVAKSWNEALVKDGKDWKEITKADIMAVMGKTMDAIADIIFEGLAVTMRMHILKSTVENFIQILKIHL